MVLRVRLVFVILHVRSATCVFNCMVFVCVVFVMCTTTITTATTTCCISAWRMRPASSFGRRRRRGPEAVAGAATLTKGSGSTASALPGSPSASGPRKGRRRSARRTSSSHPVGFLQRGDKRNATGKRHGAPPLAHSRGEVLQVPPPEAFRDLEADRLSEEEAEQGLGPVAEDAELAQLQDALLLGRLRAAEVRHQQEGVLDVERPGERHGEHALGDLLLRAAPDEACSRSGCPPPPARCRTGTACPSEAGPASRARPAC